MTYKRRKIREGRVLGNGMDKTVVVSVEWRQSHRLYKKAIKRWTKFKAHDEKNECGLGDLVRIVETRPLSKTKRWKVAEIIARGDVPEIAAVEIQDIEARDEIGNVAPQKPENVSNDGDQVSPSAIVSEPSGSEGEAAKEDL